MRSKPEKKEEKEKVRLALMSATLRLAAAHGFASVGLREASREAGIAPTSFYRHFADMEDVGRALVDELVSGVVQRCSARVEGKALDSVGAAEAMLDELFLAVAEDPTLVRFFIAERVGAFPPIRTARRKQLDQLTLALHGAVERGRPRGAAPTPVELAEAACLLLLEACNLALEADAQTLAQVRTHVLAQLGCLARAAAFAPERTP